MTRKHNRKKLYTATVMDQRNVRIAGDENYPVKTAEMNPFTSLGGALKNAKAYCAEIGIEQPRIEIDESLLLSDSDPMAYCDTSSWKFFRTHEFEYYKSASGKYGWHDMNGNYPERAKAS